MKMKQITVAQIKELLTELGASSIAIRIERPKDFKTDPRRPRIVIPGVGSCQVHGGSHNKLILNLTMDMLNAANADAIVTSPDLDLDLIRAARKPKAAVESEKPKEG